MAPLLHRAAIKKLQNENIMMAVLCGMPAIQVARLIYIVPVCYVKTGRYGKPSNAIISLHRKKISTRMWAMPNLMAALPNIGGALCSTPQSLADAHY